MSYNEQETRYYLIDPVLREKGYDDHSKLKLETPAPVEAIGHKGRRRAGGGRTDYLLCVQAGDRPKPLPVGVLEAKKEKAKPDWSIRAGFIIGSDRLIVSTASILWRAVRCGNGCCLIGWRKV
ncbi:MAG: hypothetical protein M0Q44_12940 [Methylobacter sp.]|jgi:type I site-specific restriction endonuclease|nr:hypothetical protein [Methylobacter sp.]